jgi:PAS domain S-box-containing protein
MAANNYSILVVEDNQDLVMGLRDLLRHDGYAVTDAGTVAGAIELIRTHRFNAIILDLGLPDGDGFQVLKETQRLDPSLPVVVVTAHISHDRTVGALSEGAFAYLTKPYHREELRQILRRAVGVKELAVKVEQTEHLLSQSKDRLELVIRGSHDGFWDLQVLPDEPWTSPHTPVWWSPRVKTLLGYADEEFHDVLGSWAALLHPEDADRVIAALTAHIEQRNPYNVEYRLLTKGGTYGWFHARGQAIWDETGRVTRMTGSLQDVTDRKLAEDALRRSEQLLHAVVNNTTAVIYVKYADGKYLLINRRFEQLFQLTMDQVAGRTDHEIFPKEIADAFRANDATVLKQNTAMEYEEYAPHSDGLHAYISIKFPLRDQNGEPYAICGISTDITDRKRIEHSLRAHEQQLSLALISAEVGTWNWDLQTDRIYWSAQVDRFLDLSDGACPRTKYDWLAIVYREDRESVMRTMRQALDQIGNDIKFEHRVLRSDGRLKRCIWTGQIVRGHDGTALHILGTARAIDGGA